MSSEGLRFTLSVDGIVEMATAVVGSPTGLRRGLLPYKPREWKVS